MTAVPHRPSRAVTRPSSPPRIARATPLAAATLAVGAALASIAIGPISISTAQLAAILSSEFGFDTEWAFTPQQRSVLFAIRLPRVLLGSLTGAVLAVAGAAVQGLLRNPLADPALLGVSAGAALATAGAIVVSPLLPAPLDAWSGVTLLPIAAFSGAITAIAVVHRIAGPPDHRSTATVLLAGIAINALAGSGTGLLAYIATDTQLRDITFWSLGSLGGATWSSLKTATPMMVTALLLSRRLAPSLDLLLLGESEAQYLGAHIDRLQRRIFLLVGLGVGAAVSVSGIIGFVGLVVPHLVRLAAGPAHRIVIPCSALLGAALLLAADVAARTIAAPAELPIGVLTGLFGGPFFLWLVTRNRKARWT